MGYRTSASASTLTRASNMCALACKSKSKIQRPLKKPWKKHDDALLIAHLAAVPPDFSASSWPFETAGPYRGLCRASPLAADSVRIWSIWSNWAHFFSSEMLWIYSSVDFGDVDHGFEEVQVTVKLLPCTLSPTLTSCEHVSAFSWLQMKSWHSLTTRSS